MSEEEFTVVFNATDELQALLYRSMLEEAGITVMERPLETDWLEGVKQSGLHSQLLVQEHDLELAAGLVTAFQHEADNGELAADIPEQSSETT